MKRVLQIVDSMDMGGIQTFIMNVYRYIDRERLQFDFMVFRKHKQVFEDEIIKLGGKIYKLPGRRDGYFRNRRAIKEFFDSHDEYDTIHYNTSSLSDIGILKEASARQIPVRIVHSHSTKAPGNKIHTYIHKLNKRKIERHATHYFACGQAAADWFYEGIPISSRVIIVNNGISCEEYSYNEIVRKELRNTLKIDDHLVIGHVGRFSKVKNHSFIIEVFNYIVKNCNYIDPRLVLVGDGELVVDIKKRVEELQLKDKVLFLGTRHDVPKLLQAMDVMLMPSLYEGFPVTVVEAQAAGLPVVMSDTITKDAVIKKNVRLENLSAPLSVWAEKTINCGERETDNELLINAGFDINTTVKYLENVYFMEE